MLATLSLTLFATMSSTDPASSSTSSLAGPRAFKEFAARFFQDKSESGRRYMVMPFDVACHAGCRCHSHGGEDSTPELFKFAYFCKKIVKF